MSSAPRGLAPREGLELELMKMGRTGPPLLTRRRPQAGKSGDPRSQNADTTQLVKHKALNLVDVNSSPMMGVTSYDVLFKEVYIKSQLNIILLSRPLGATRCC